MNGARLVVVAVSILVIGCSGGSGQTANSGQSQAAGATSAAGAASAAPVTPAAGAGSGSSLADVAAAIKDACTVMPTDLAATIVPGGGAPQSEQFPTRCTISNGTVILVITLSAFDTSGAVSGAESVPGLAAGAYLEHLTAGNTYLTVLLTPDQGKLWVEIDNDDGKDHKDQAIAVANAVLAKLG